MTLRTRPLRVLLVSAVAAADPHSGDITYTEQLLAHPPPGVSYTTYDRAIQEGALRELGTRADLRSSTLRQTRRGISAALGALRHVEHRIRASGAVFREPIRVLEADPTAFDLVHVHVFNTRFVGSSPPVVMSAGGPLEWVYGDAWGWSSAQLRRANFFDDAMGSLLDATLHARRLGRARRFVAFSEHLREWVTSAGLQPEVVDVVPNYISLEPWPPRREVPRPRRIGFVAKDFTAKGGDLVLAAFDLLRQTDPALELVIVGSVPQLDPDELGRRGIRWHAFVERPELLDQVLPGLDVLVHPSRVDGLPYTPMEGLAHGIPLVVSDYRALPELVRNGAGRVARGGDPTDIARAIRELLDPQANAEASLAAARHFTARFSAESQAPALRESYDRALRPG